MNAIYNVYIGILSFCGIVITDEICHMSFNCVAFDLDWYDAIMSRRYLRVDFTMPIVVFSSQFLVYVRNLPSLCM